MKHSRNVRHMKDNGSAQDCRHKEKPIRETTEGNEGEQQLEPTETMIK